MSPYSPFTYLLNMLHHVSYWRGYQHIGGYPISHALADIFARLGRRHAAKPTVDTLYQGLIKYRIGISGGAYPVLNPLHGTTIFVKCYICYMPTETCRMRDDTR